jgi:hypothetical protein
VSVGGGGAGGPLGGLVGPGCCTTTPEAVGAGVALDGGATVLPGAVFEGGALDPRKLDDDEEPQPINASDAASVALRYFLNLLSCWTTVEHERRHAHARRKSRWRVKQRLACKRCESRIGRTTVPRREEQAPGCTLPNSGA